MTSNEEKIGLIAEYRDVLNALRHLRSGDRSALAVASGISWPTLKKAIDLLEKKGAIQPEKCDNETIYVVKKEYAYFAGIYIANGCIKIALCDFSFQPLKVRDIRKFKCLYEKLSSEKENGDWKEDGSVISYPVKDDRGELINKVNAIIECLVPEEPDEFHLLGVTVTYPGLIDYKVRTISFSPNMQSIDGMSLDMLLFSYVKQKLNDRHILTHFENDMEASLMWEKEKLYDRENRNYRLRNKQNIGFVFIGGGIGLGYVLNHTLVRGCTGSAGEIGHIPAPDLDIPAVGQEEEEDQRAYTNQNGEEEPQRTVTACKCKQSNCLEKRLMLDVFNANEKPDYFKKIDKKNLRDFAQRHKYRYKVLEGYLCCILRMLINLFNFDVIIFTGPIIHHIDDMRKRLKLLHRTCGALETPLAACTIYVSDYEDAMLAGACIAAYNKCGLEDTDDPIDVKWLDTWDE